MAKGRGARSVRATEGEFRGNKAALPSKPCAACGRTMTWRKKWASNWDQVRFCSDRCRATGLPRGDA